MVLTTVSERIKKLSALGILNADAAWLVVDRNREGHGLLTPQLEFYLDCCACANSQVDTVLQESGNNPSKDDHITLIQADNAVCLARELWYAHGRPVEKLLLTAAAMMVIDYFVACNDVRVQQLFKEKGSLDGLHLHTLLYQANLNFDCFDRVVKLVTAQPGDIYTEEYLRSVIALYKQREGLL